MNRKPIKRRRPLLVFIDITSPTGKPFSYREKEVNDRYPVKGAQIKVGIDTYIVEEYLQDMSVTPQCHYYTLFPVTRKGKQIPAEEFQKMMMERMGQSMSTPPMPEMPLTADFPKNEFRLSDEELENDIPIISPKPTQGTEITSDETKN